jgi:rubredoxin
VQIEPKLNSFLKELGLLAELRNGIIHLGLIPQADARNILIAYAKAIEILSRIGGLDLATFFQDFASVVQVHLDESVAEVNKIVTEKVVKARNDFERRYENFSDTERKAVFASLASTLALPQHEAELIDCPVCKQQGFLSGQFDVEWDVDYDNEGYPERANPTVTLIGDSFFCPVCGLELKDFTELEAAGVDTAVDIDDFDPSEFYGEPDHELR